MTKDIKTNFMHRIGPVVISTGIGDTMYGAYAVKPNGSLKRLTFIEQSVIAREVGLFLLAYKGKAIWRKP